MAGGGDVEVFGEAVAAVTDPEGDFVVLLLHIHMDLALGGDLKPVLHGIQYQLVEDEGDLGGLVHVQLDLHAPHIEAYIAVGEHEGALLVLDQSFRDRPDAHVVEVLSAEEVVNGGDGENPR